MPGCLGGLQSGPQHNHPASMLRRWVFVSKGPTLRAMGQGGALPYSNRRNQGARVATIDLSEFKRGWTVVLACAAGIACGLSAMPFFTFGAFIVPFQEEFGWNRAEIQSALTLYGSTVFITLPIIGKVLDRVGARRVAITSQLAFVVSFGSLAFLPNNLIVFYGMWMVMAAVSIGSMAITYSFAINTWFDRHRGIALGLTLSGTGMAATFAPAYAVWLIESFGWRFAFPGMAAVTLVVSVPLLVLFLKDRPPAAPTQTDTHAPASPEDVPGVTLSEAARNKAFWIIGFGMFGVSAGTGGMIPILIPLLGESGYSAADAAFYAGIVGLMVIGGRVLVGLLMDHVWAPMVAFLFFAPSALSCFLLMINGISPAAVVVSVVLIGLVAGAEFDVIAFLTGRYFGLKHFGTIYSWVYLIFISATVAAPFVYGMAYDTFGSYDIPLLVTGILIVIGSCLLLTIGPIPKDYAPAHLKSSSENA